MQLIPWHSTKSYHRAQQLTQRRRKGSHSGLRDQEARRITSWLFQHRPERYSHGICHGAMRGTERDILEQYLPGSHVLATDLFPLSPTVIRHDFHATPVRWRHKFDWVYSNSLDHAHDPRQALRSWMQQLKPQGVLLLHWTHWHLFLGKGDCFAASLNEYMQLVGETGRMLDLIFLSQSYRHRRKAAAASVRNTSVIVVGTPT